MASIFNALPRCREERYQEFERFDFATASPRNANKTRHRHASVWKSFVKVWVPHSHAAAADASQSGAAENNIHTIQQTKKLHTPAQTQYKQCHLTH